MPERFRIGLIIPLDEEYEAVKAVLPAQRSLDVEDETFYVLQTPGGEPILTAVVGDMGQEAAALVADRLARQGLELLVVVGIAGSLSEDAVLGDVVIPDLVDLYGNAAKAVPRGSAGFRLKLSGAPYRLDYAIQRAVRAFFRRPELDAARTAWAQRGEDRRRDLGLDNPEALSVSRTRPAVRIGHIASGAEVGASAAFGKWLKTRDRAFVAIEMESGGVSMSAHRRVDALPLLILRGISDYSDEQKSAMEANSEHWPKGAWRMLAAQNAADLLVTLVDEGVVPGAKAAAPVPAPPAGPPSQAVAQPDAVAELVVELSVHVDLATASTVAGPTSGQLLRQCQLLKRRLPYLLQKAKGVAGQLDAERSGLGATVVGFLEEDFEAYVDFAHEVAWAKEHDAPWITADEDFDRSRKAAYQQFRTGWSAIERGLDGSERLAAARASIDWSETWRVLGFPSASAFSEYRQPTMDSLVESPGALATDVLTSLLDAAVNVEALEDEGVPPDLCLDLINRLLTSGWATMDAEHTVTLTRRGRELLAARLAQWGAAAG